MKGTILYGDAALIVKMHHLLVVQLNLQHCAHVLRVDGVLVFTVMWSLFGEYEASQGMYYIEFGAAYQTW